MFDGLAKEKSEADTRNLQRRAPVTGALTRVNSMAPRIKHFLGFYSSFTSFVLGTILRYDAVYEWTLIPLKAVRLQHKTTQRLTQIDVHQFSGVEINENVLNVPIAKSDNIANFKRKWNQNNS